jgi:hypothetical protein
MTRLHERADPGGQRYFHAVLATALARYDTLVSKCAGCQDGELLREARHAHLLETTRGGTWRLPVV